MTPVRSQCSAGVAAFALALIFALSGCSPPPALDGVEASFAPARPGSGAAASVPRVATSLARTGFGTQIAQAVQSSPSLKVSNAQIRAAQAEQKAQSGAFLPEVSLGVQAGTRSLTGLDADSITPLVQITQLVYDGGASAARLTAARARVYQSRGGRLETVASMAMQAVEAYHRLLSQRRILQVARENLAAHQSLAAQIEDRVASGAGSRADVLTAKSRLADAVSLEVRAMADLERAQATFQEMFGHPPEARLSDPGLAPALPRGTLDAVVRDSPRLRSLEAGIKAAEAEIVAATAARLPQFLVGATGRRNSNGNGDVSFDMALSYDLFSRGAREARIAASKARHETALAERDTLMREIRRALDFVLSDQTAGQARVRAARQAAEANAASLEAARDQFTIGRRSLIELLDAQRDYRNAQEVLILAEQDRALTDYAALALTGDIIDAFKITLPDMDTPS